MTVRIGEIVLDCSDPKRAAEFWCAALGYRITDRDETGVAIAGDSSAPTMLLLATSDVKHHKNRVHLDVCPVDGTNHADEVRRLEELGATRLEYGQTGSWTVMADPVGNEFCVMETVLPAEPAPFHHLR
jgi:catechol 2,3-dioxygenase-like lactoylglutathione lyase family enzyme